MLASAMIASIAGFAAANSPATTVAPAAGVQLYAEGYAGKLGRPTGVVIVESAWCGRLYQ